MEKVKLTLTDPEGTVLAEWTIGNELESEFDVENLAEEPECDFYVDNTWNDMDAIGAAVWDEAEKHFKQVV